MSTDGSQVDENARAIAELQQRLRDRTAELEQVRDEIRRISLADELTGLHNRRSFYLLGDQTLRLARREGRPAHAVYIDIDGLKAVNDQLGHEMGDALISDVARAIKAAFRESDVLGRIGAGEFCVLTLDPLEEAEALRRRIAAALADFTRGRPFQASVSVGIAAYGPEESLDALISRADQATYFEKRGKTAAARAA